MANPPIQQDLSAGNYTAVTPIVAGGMFVPKRDATNNVLTAALPLTLLADQTGVPLGTSTSPLFVTATGGSGGAVFGPTAVGSPAANPPVLFGGTADGTATGNVSVAKVTAGAVTVQGLETAGTTVKGGGIIAFGSDNSGNAVPLIIKSGILVTVAGSAVAASGNSQAGGLVTTGGTAIPLQVVSYLYNGAGTSTAKDLVGAVTTGVGTTAVHGAPTSVAGAGVAPAATTVAASSIVLKASAGNLYGVNVSSSAAGFLMLFDATTAPADGTVTPKFVYPIGANGGQCIPFDHPLHFATGITAVFSSNASPFSKTASATAFISGLAV